MLELIEETKQQEQDTDGNKIFAHYAEAAKVTESYVLGTPIEALCGKMFIPHRDPRKYPICPECKELVEIFSLDSEK